MVTCERSTVKPSCDASASTMTASGFGPDLPRSAATHAVQVTVDLLRQDVVLLVAVVSVPVFDQPQVLEQVERPIHR